MQTFIAKKWDTDKKKRGFEPLEPPQTFQTTQTFSPQILHQYLYVSALAEFRYTFLSNLPHSLACQSELVANFLKTFLVTTYAEAFADDDNFSLLEYVL